MKLDREVLFKVMLGALGLATLCGIIAVLTSSYETVGRIASTAALTAVISAILWKTNDVDFEESQYSEVILWSGCGIVFLSTLAGIWSTAKTLEFWLTSFLTAFVSTVAWKLSLDLHGDKRDRSRLIVAAGIVLCYASGLLGIWLSGSELQGKFGASAVVFLLTSVGSAMGWNLRNQEGQWLCGSTVLGLSSSSLFVWLFGIWCADAFSSNGPQLEEQFYQLGISLAGWGTLAAICLTGWTRDDDQMWRWAGVAAAVLGWCLSNVVIFSNPTTDTAADFAFVMASISLFVVYLLIIGRLELNDWQILLRNGTIASVALTALLVDLLILTNTSGDTFLVRLAIAAALAGSSGTLALVFIGKPQLDLLTGSENETDDEEVWVEASENGAASGEFSHVQLFCPRCHHKQKIAIGSGTCSDCDLKIRISVST